MTTKTIHTTRTHETHPAARVARAPRRWIGSLITLAALLLPAIATAQDEVPNAAVDLHEGWSLNFTPVVIAPTDNHGWGGGADPELKYTADLGRARLSAGGRIGAYYAKDLFGLTFMPTLRLMVPVGRMEPYVAFGMGYGWLPKLEHTGVATMSRLGIVYRLSDSFALGVEGTVQAIEGSRHRFPSFGSMMAFDL